jgi:hypothetical protein
LALAPDPASGKINGIFQSMGDSWHRLRSIVAQGFTVNKIKMVGKVDYK